MSYNLGDLLVLSFWIFVIVAIIVFKWIMGNDAIEQWGELAKEWGCKVIKYKKNPLSIPRYNIKHMGHIISVSTAPSLGVSSLNGAPGSSPWMGTAHDRGICFFIDHFYNGEINFELDPSDIHSVELAVKKFKLKPEIKEDIISLGPGRLYVRKCFLQFIDGSLFFSADKEYFNEIAGKLIVLADALGEHGSPPKSA